MPDVFSHIAALSVGSTLDFVIIFCFIAYAVIYFLAPVLGYPADRRGLILMSLYALLAYGIVVLLQLIIAYILYLSESNNSRGAINITYLFAILKFLLFLASMAAFTFGLQSLKRNHP